MIKPEFSSALEALLNQEINKEAAIKQAEKQADAELISRYVANQIRKEEADRAAIEKEANDKSEAFAKFEQFEKTASPEMINKLRQVKRVLLDNPSLIESVDPNFVNGIMFLNLGDE